MLSTKVCVKFVEVCVGVIIMCMRRWIIISRVYVLIVLDMGCGLFMLGFGDYTCDMELHLGTYYLNKE